MFLSKEATNKDKSLRIEMLLFLEKSDSSNSDKIWKKNVFFDDQKTDSIITKVNFPENTLVYCNQGTISTLKAGDYAIYLDHAILGKIILANNSLPNFDNCYKRK